MKKYVLSILVLAVLCGSLLACSLPEINQPRPVHADDITEQDTALLENYCMNEFTTHRSVKLGHSHGESGTLYYCIDEHCKDSSQIGFHDIEFLPGISERKSYDGNAEMTLYFKIRGYCSMEQQDKTFYSNVTLTNPKRDDGKLIWDKIDMEAIAQMTDSLYLYRFADNPQYTGD